MSEIEKLVEQLCEAIRREQVGVLERKLRVFMSSHFRHIFWNVGITLKEEMPIEDVVEAYLEAMYRAGRDSKKAEMAEKEVGHLSKVGRG